MGQNSTGLRRTATQTQVLPAGLDLGRMEYNRFKGIYQVSPGATFQQGAPVALDSTGAVVLANGAQQVLGVAMWAKASTMVSMVVDQAIVFPTANSTVTLQPGLGTVALYPTAGAPATGPYTVTTDYTVNTTAGTVTVVSASGTAPAVGTTIYASYTFTLSPAQQLIQGFNYHNVLDYTQFQEGKITVIKAPAEIFTTAFDQTVNYTYTGATSNIYVNTAGLFTTATAGSAKLVGHVLQPPVAGDSFLGIEFFGNVGVNA